MASFYVYGFLLALLIFNVATQVPNMRNSQKGGDSFIKCALFSVCECRDIGPWKECFDAMMFMSKQEIIRSMAVLEDCKDINTSNVGEDIQFVDMVDVFCTTPPEKWDTCYEKTKEYLSGYVQEMSTSEEEIKKKESNHMEDARTCGTAMVASRCKGMGIGECSDDF